MLNFFLDIIFHLLPPGVMDFLGNASLPETDRAFKVFGRIRPSVFEYYSGKKAVYMFRKVAREVPAYGRFLREHNINPKEIKTIDDFNSRVPQTTKENYVRAYSLTERCVNGQFPRDISLEESSGTSGESTYWIRSEEEEQYTMSLMKASFRHLYGFRKEEKFFVINCFLLGGWTGGLRFASRIGSLASVKNIGPDPEKVIRCIKELGNSFSYLISGYPPFIMELIEFGKNQDDFRWKDFRIHIFAGGEGFVEEWREYIASQLREGTLIYSDYGAIDLDAGISVETPFSVALKKLILKDPELRIGIFGSDRLPCYVGQFSNQQYYIRKLENKDGRNELEITVMNLKAVSPNIKYVIGDEGGIIRFQDLCNILEKKGYTVSGIKDDNGINAVIAFPVIWLYGRSDGTVMIHGAMISPMEISRSIMSDPVLVSTVNTFRMSVDPDKDNLIRLYISLEARKNAEITESLIEISNDVILNKLIESNECYRNSYWKDPLLHRPVITWVPFRTGIFSKENETAKRVYTK